MDIIGIINIILLIVGLYTFTAWMFAKAQGSTLCEFWGIPIYEFGRCRERSARRHRLTGTVEFVMYDLKTKEAFWYKFDSKFYHQFKQNDLYKPHNGRVIL